MTQLVDAVVIGSGPNGLAGANVLADAGWDVVVLEAQPSPGGAVRTEELTQPGFHHDVFSSFYPLGAASPALLDLALEDHGLRWCRSDAVAVHVLDRERTVSLHQDPERTAESVATFAPSDREAWLRWSAWWERIGPHLIESLMRPFPPIGPGMRLLRSLGPRGMIDFARLGVLPVRQHAREEFAGEGAALLLAGNALHADFTPESPGSSIFAWTLVGLGQQVGFPVPRGGASGLTDALVTRLRRAGGDVRCGEEVVRIDGATRTVHTAQGTSLQARHAILAATSAPALYEQLLDRRAVPPRVLRDMTSFDWDPSTIKVDWALDGPIPWSAPQAARAGTVHIADDLDHLSAWSAEVQRGAVPRRPFLVMGQYAAMDPTRMPAGKEIAYAYTHLPQGSWTPDVTDSLVDAMQAEIEQRAPGFSALVRARHVLTPQDLEARDANLVGGALNGGTAQLHQQLIFRPIAGTGRAETAIAGVYLASASAHPGGGVHGAAGTNAARAALAAARPPQRVAAAAARALSSPWRDRVVARTGA